MPLAARLLLLTLAIAGPPLLVGADFVLWAGLPAGRLAALAGSLVPGVVLVWHIGTRLVARPWRRLSEAALAWSEGDWRARIDAVGTSEEFRRLALRLNGIAERVDEEQLLLQHLAERAEALGQEAARAKTQLVDALDAIPEGFAIFDTEDRFLLCNGRFREIHAETSDLLRAGEPFARIIREGAERGQFNCKDGDVESWIAERLALRAQPGTTFEQQLATGEWFRITDRRTSDGGIISVCIDITELKQREATFRLLFEDNPLPMMVYDFRSLRFLEVNNAAIAHYGYSRERFLAMTVDELPPPEDRGAAGGPRRLGTQRHLKADGSLMIVETISYQLHFRGRFAELIAALDVTEQKRAEEALRSSEARLRKSQEHLARAQQVAEIGSFERDLRTNDIFWSDNLYRIFGLEKGAYMPTPENVLDLVHPDDRERYLEYRKGFAAGTPHQSIQYRILRAGEVRHLVCENECIRDAEGTLVGILGTVIDTTMATRIEERQRELELQLQHAQRVEALGTLAGGIAHDLNNTMVPVVTLAKLTLKRLAEGSVERGNLEMIHEAGMRARGLVKQILTFSRKDKAARERLDMAAFIERTLGMLRASVPATIGIDYRAEEGLPAVLGDPSQLHQVLINLITNAVQAIGGEIGAIRIGLAAAEGGVRLRLADSGCGMDKTTLSRVFEPFFTTKPVGEGTGLGLSVVHGIIGSHGGRIDVASEVGRGTEFTIWLPAAEAESAAALSAMVPA